MISIILVEPQTPGNIGAVARVMKNFGFYSLILINPKCDPLSPDSKNRAKWAQDILKRAKIKTSIPKLHTLIATTSQVGTDYNIPRSPITPSQLSKRLNIDKKIGLVFGREGTGLTNEEISGCDFTLTIPTHKRYPTLNLSHSVSIILYEIFKSKDKENIIEHIKAAQKKDKEHLLSLIDIQLKSMDFKTSSKRKTQQVIWKRIIGKSFLTKREAFALMGFFKKLR